MDTDTKIVNKQALYNIVLDISVKGKKNIHIYVNN